MIPPPLCNACDFVFQFNFTAHIPGKMNTAADILSRLEMDPVEKIILKTEKTFQQNRWKLTLNSESLHKRNWSFLISQTSMRPQKKNFGNVETGNATPNDPRVNTVPCYYANDLHKDTTIVNIAQLTKPSSILIEQDSDPTLLTFKREMLGLPDEQIQKMMHVKCTIPETKSELLSKMIYFVDNTITILWS